MTLSWTNKPASAGSTLVDLLIFLVALLVAVVMGWLLLPASSADIQMEVRQDQPYPISYRVLQAFLRAHPNPTNENLIDIHLSLDHVRARELVTETVNNAPRSPSTLTRGASSASATAPTATKLAAKSPVDDGTTPLELILIAMVALSAFPLLMRLVLFPG